MSSSQKALFSKQSEIYDWKDSPPTTNMNDQQNFSVGSNEEVRGMVGVKRKSMESESMDFDNRWLTTKEIVKPPKKRKTSEMEESAYASNSHLSIDDIGSSSSMQKSSLNLNEWLKHRVLACRDSVYSPGKITSVKNGGVVGITFDNFDATQVEYGNILDINCSTIISDYTPPTVMLKTGTAVCVKVPSNNQVKFLLCHMQMRKNHAF